MTLILDALATTSRVNDWLGRSQSPRILHIFDRACNLIDEYHEVLSVVTPEIGNGPFNLVVESDVLFTSHISLESPVSNTSTELQLGNFIVQTQRAQVWEAHPHWNALHTKRESILQHAKELTLPHSAPILQFFANHPRQGTNSLSSSLANADLPSSIMAATKIAGLGQGLTPSGDDYIMGALYAAWLIHPPENAERIAREVATVAAPLTTSLSGAWLKAAGTGEAGVMWHDFLEALAFGEQSAIDLHFSRLLSIGATSGADALAGFIDTIISYIALERKHVVSKVL